MSTLLSLPTPDILPPAAEVMAPETHPVQDYHVELMEAARHLRLNLARVAYYGFRMRLCDGWTAMGYESGPRGEEAYRERLGIPSKIIRGSMRPKPWRRPRSLSLSPPGTRPPAMSVSRWPA